MGGKIATLSTHRFGNLTLLDNRAPLCKDKVERIFFALVGLIAYFLPCRGQTQSICKQSFTKHVTNDTESMHNLAQILFFRKRGRITQNQVGFFRCWSALSAIIYALLCYDGGCACAYHAASTPYLISLSAYDFIRETRVDMTERHSILRNNRQK